MDFKTGEKSASHGAPAARRRRTPEGGAGASLGRAARRLLAALAQEGACPARADLRDGFLAVAAPRNGVTSIVANVPVAAGDELVERGLARWSGAGPARRLALRSEGVAEARRLAAPPGADPFLAQHSVLRIRAPAHGETPALFDESESPLAWLARRKGKDGRPYLSYAQIEAGERYRRDIATAQILPRVTSDWSGAASSRAARGPDRFNVSDLAITARQRLDRAAEAVGPELNGLVVDVCGFQKGLELVERERSWPPRSAKIVLRIALDRLADHYGLASKAQGPNSGRMRRWGADDYRPLLEPPA